MKRPEIYEGLYVSDDKPIFKFTDAVKFEHTKPIKILRTRRIYDRVPENTWFKSPNKIRKYVPVRIIVEYL